MRGKLLFVAGLAAGYVIGARAGRPAYDAVVERVQGFRANPTVQKVGTTAKEKLEEKAPKVADTLEKAAKTTTEAAQAAAAATDGTEQSTEDAPSPSKRSPAPKPTPPTSGGGTDDSPSAA